MYIDGEGISDVFEAMRKLLLKLERSEKRRGIGRDAGEVVSVCPICHKYDNEEEEALIRGHRKGCELRILLSSLETYFGY